MPPTPSPTTQELFAVLHAWLAANLPGFAPKSLRVTFWNSVEQLQLPLPAAPPELPARRKPE